MKLIRTEFVTVDQRHDGDVGIAGLGDGLVVGAGVGHQEQAGLTKNGLDLIGKGSGGEVAGDGADVAGKLQRRSGRPS